MSFKKIISAVLLSAFVTATFAGCSNSDTQTADEATVKISSSSTSSNADDSSTDDEMFTARDKEIGYDESECETITLSDNASTSSLKSVKIDGNTITVSEEGTYIVSGTLSDGQIIIDGDKSEKIRLILDGVTINSNAGAPIYVKQTDKLFITLAESSKNVLTNNKQFTADGDNNVDAVIFSKDDITLNGNGSLEITTNCGHGIVSKDDLKITSGTYSITSSSHALDGKDSMRIASGTFTLNSDKDGINSENADDTSLGFIYIAGGTFRITSDGDGMDASAYLTILDCNATIKSGGGASNAEKKQEEFGRMEDASSSTDSDTASAKGIKAGGNLTISGGTINVTESYEGIEGLEITVSGGTISVVSSDDGFNAAGGNDSSGYGGGMPQDNFSAVSDAKITISGGKITVDAKGDGLDSNGSLCVSGGEIFVTGPSDNGNGALDYNGDAQITGGTIVAVGMSGMTQNFGSSSTQGSILSNTATNTSGEVVLKDSNGNVLVSFTPTREYNSVVVSTPDVKKGSTYTLTTGDSSTTIEMSDIIYGESTQGGAPNGGGQGGLNGRGQAPNGNMGGGFGNRP